MTESPECEMCHEPPVNGFTTHILTPSEAIPPQNLSAEICGDCHTGQHNRIYVEWNEYNNSDYDTLLMESHSEPSENRDTTQYNNTSGLRVTCVICHEPHNTELRMPEQELCASCHSSGNSLSENESLHEGGSQWEMYDGSIYTNGVHSVNLGCVDCHMATITDGSEEREPITGHSFNFDPALLSDPYSGNICKKCHVTGHDKIPESGDCDECHEVSLSNITSSRQEITKSKLQELELLQENASNMLMSDDNGTLQKQTEDYNEAVEYISKVRSDGSLGMHNMERTLDYLEKAEILLRSIIGEKITESSFEFADSHEKEGKKETTTPGTGTTDFFLIIFITAFAITHLKRNRGR